MHHSNSNLGCRPLSIVLKTRTSTDIVTLQNHITLYIYTPNDVWHYTFLQREVIGILTNRDILYYEIIALSVRYMCSVHQNAHDSFSYLDEHTYSAILA